MPSEELVRKVPPKRHARMARLPRGALKRAKTGEYMVRSLLLVHQDEYANWVFDSDHPTQGRRFINARDLLLQTAADRGVEVGVLPATGFASSGSVDYDLDSLLRTVHTDAYLHEVLVDGKCGEWQGSRPDLGAIARLFVAGTLTAFDQLHARRTLTAVNFPGAKHHAHADHSSGFCVFADFAVAAREAVRLGHRVAIFDFDGHHGDGTEELLADQPGVLTYSVHQAGIFPGTGQASDPSRDIYNWPLPAGAGSADLMDASHDFIVRAKRFQPSMIFIAAGADGHQSDSLTGLQYHTGAYASVGNLLRSEFPQLPFLVGGAGGYRPDDVTPRVWTEFALALATVNRKEVR